MSTGLVYHGDYLRHRVGPNCPEVAARLEAVVAGLRRAGLWEKLALIEPKKAGLAAVERVHSRGYLERFRAACSGGAGGAGGGFIDSEECPTEPETWRLALLGAGGALAGVEAVMGGKVDNAFCAVRPPGHHAGRERAMGFCYLNNVAIAAEELIRGYGLGRVAIVDFDVHHGNGTQDIFYERPDVLFVSLHEDPGRMFPGTGYSGETGKGAGEGFTLNIPLAAGAGDAEMLGALRERVVPRLEEFKPEFMLVSAGFDAAKGDLLGHMEVTPEGFAEVTRLLVDVAGRQCGGRMVSVLEGGYELEGLAVNAAAHVGALMG